jgi:hypothetical protein
MSDINAASVVMWESGSDLESYVARMRNISTWGGGIEIKSFCERFNVAVAVYFGDKIINFSPDNNNANATIHIKYTGNHYEPYGLTM